MQGLVGVAFAILLVEQDAERQMERMQALACQAVVSAWMRGSWQTGG